MIPFMKKNIASRLQFLLLSLFLLMVSGLSAQSFLSFDVGQQYTTFRFIDSNGSQDKEYSAVYSGAYSAGYRYAASSGFLFRGSLGLNNAGATKVYDAMNYSWELKYATLRLGAGWMFGKGSLRPYFSVAPYYARLLSAVQVLNNEEFDILASKSIADDDFGIEILPGVQYSVSSKLSVYAEFNYRMGLQNLDTDEGQTSNNRAAGASLGVALNITK